MKKDGFTLIELLAVIVILGIVVAIAIPGINSVINNSRKKSFFEETTMIVDSVITGLTAEIYPTPMPNEAVIIPFSEMELEKGSTKFENNRSFVGVANHSGTLVYFVSSKDTNGNYVSLTLVENFTIELINKSGTDAALISALAPNDLWVSEPLIMYSK